MNQAFRILCAVDRSDPAQAAFRQALALSRDRGGELTVVHAVPKDRPFNWHARERIAMIAALRQMATDAGVPLTVSVQHGDPAGVILLHARARRPHLMVIGTHQRIGLSRLLTGSIAESVTLGATCPVLIVPGRNRGLVTDATTSFRSILCAFDFSAAGNAALNVALSLAQKNDRRITVVHVAKGISPADVSRYRHRFRVPESQTLLGHDVYRRLQGVIPVALRGARRIHARAVTGDPATEIVRAARAVNADVIVVGVRSRGVIGRRIFSATATKIMRRAGRLVLAVPEVALQKQPPPSDAKGVAVAA